MTVERDDQPKLKIKEVAERVGLSVSTVRNYYRDRDSGFPQPVIVGKRALRWRLSDVDHWLQTRPSR